MIHPSSFAIHVTYACPLTCASCCFSSGPKVKDSLSMECITETIKNIDASLFKMIAFTGGEPFLLGKNLDLAVNMAHSKGLVTRVVTSAYWAKQVQATERRLSELRDAGLDELSISWDDFHEEQSSTRVTFDQIYNAYWAAKRLGLTVAVNIVQAENSRWDAKRVRAELGIDSESNDIVVESPLNITGRAENELTDVGLRSERFLGPCPYVLSGPTLSAKKKLLACCGVIPHTDELVLDDNYEPSRLSISIASGLSSPLLNWLYIRGPYAILEWLSDKYGVAIPRKNSIGGNCEACRLLFHTNQYKELISQAVDIKKSEIAGEIAILNALGFFDEGAEKSVMEIWQNGIPLIDSAILHDTGKPRDIKEGNL